MGEFVVCCKKGRRTESARAPNYLIELKGTPMTIGQAMAMELEHEAVSARKTLERIPNDKLDWTPHPKSMTFQNLASHVASLLNWAKVSLSADEFDMQPTDGTKHPHFVGKSPSEIVAEFDKNLVEALAALRAASDADFSKTWRLKNAGVERMALPKAAVIRGFVLNHLVHHRAQLGLYLRLNDVSVPSMIGPSADEES